MPFIEVAKVTDIKSGEGKALEVNGVALALFNVNGTFHALANTCPHRGGPLGEGQLDGSTITCPWHGWQFDVTTGDNAFGAGGVKKYTVKVEGDKVLVEV